LGEAGIYDPHPATAQIDGERAIIYSRSSLNSRIATFVPRPVRCIVTGLHRLVHILYHELETLHRLYAVGCALWNYLQWKTRIPRPLGLLGVLTFGVNYHLGETA